MRTIIVVDNCTSCKINKNNAVKVQKVTHLCNGEDVGALVVLDEVGHSEHDGTHTEAEGPGDEDHPPATAGLHDHSVAHALPWF